MEKSDYGKEITFFYEGPPLHHDQVMTTVVDSTLSISPSLREEIDKEFAKAVENNPNFTDAPKWRYEGHELPEGGINILVSLTSYKPHFVLRKKDFGFSYDDNRFASNWPNPYNINPIQVTENGKGHILIGEKGKISDQKGLGLMGAGFINVAGSQPENMFVAALRESAEETNYDQGCNPHDIETLRLMGPIFGSNHDTTMSIYVPVPANKDQVRIGNLEHTEMLHLPTDLSSLEDFLNKEGMNGIQAVDHLIGSVELFYNAKKAGHI
jgi:hypothetical protein